MKLIIDIPEKVVTAIQNGEDYRYDIHTTIAQGIPYEERPTGDLISREALKEAIYERQYYIEGVDEVYNAIDNAPTVDAVQYTLGYQDGFLEGKKIFERPQGE